MIFLHTKYHISLISNQNHLTSSFLSSRQPLLPYFHPCRVLNSSLVSSIDHRASSSLCVSWIIFHSPPRMFDQDYENSSDILFSEVYNCRPNLISDSSFAINCEPPPSGIPPGCIEPPTLEETKQAADRETMPQLVDALEGVNASNIQDLASFFEIAKDKESRQQLVASTKGFNGDGFRRLGSMVEVHYHDTLSGISLGKNSVDSSSSSAKELSFDSAYLFKALVQELITSYYKKGLIENQDDRDTALSAGFSLPEDSKVSDSDTTKGFVVKHKKGYFSIYIPITKNGTHYFFVTNNSKVESAITQLLVDIVDQLSRSVSVVFPHFIKFNIKDEMIQIMNQYIDSMKTVEENSIFLVTLEDETELYFYVVCLCSVLDAKTDERKYVVNIITSSDSNVHHNSYIEKVLIELVNSAVGNNTDIDGVCPNADFLSSETAGVLEQLGFKLDMSIDDYKNCPVKNSASLILWILMTLLFKHQSSTYSSVGGLVKLYEVIAKQYVNPHLDRLEVVNDIVAWCILATSLRMGIADLSPNDYESFDDLIVAPFLSSLEVYTGENDNNCVYILTMFLY